MKSQTTGAEECVLELKRQCEPLILRRAAVARRFDALFKAMSTDFLLREQFITDPAQIASEYVYGANLPPQKASVSNQLLYSVMSNQKLIGWLRDYAVKRSGNPPSRNEFASDFGRAVVDHGGHHVVLALIRNSVEKESFVGFHEGLLAIIFGIFADVDFLAGTEMSTGTFATEQSGTHMSTGGLVGSGTEMSTGTFATEQSGTHRSTGGLVGSGTEMSTGTFATEQSGTHMSTGGLVGSGTEMSTGTFATEQSGTHMSTGGLVGSGTEMSTGTFATEQSGTHMSTGGRPGLFGSRYAQVTLEALARYATQLREAGALDVIWSD